jgi:prophage regulatory protein
VVKPAGLLQAWDHAVTIRRRVTAFPRSFLVASPYDGSMTEKPPRPLRFLSIEQVAQELNVGEPLVRAMLKSGELRGIQVGGRGVWRIGIADLDAYIEEAYRRTAEKISRGAFAESRASEV